MRGGMGERLGLSRTVVAVGNERRGAGAGCREPLGPKDGEGAFWVRSGALQAEGGGGTTRWVCPAVRAAWAARAGKLGGAIRPGLDDGGSMKLGLALGSMDRRARFVAESIDSVNARFDRSA
jgi:hypothetical protein